MPKNLFARENQTELKNFLTDTFDKSSFGVHHERGVSQNATQARMNQTQMSKTMFYDTFSFGFDMPAGMQINRMTKKVDKWITAKDRLEE